MREEPPIISKEVRPGFRAEIHHDTYNEFDNPRLDYGSAVKIYFWDNLEQFSDSREINCYNRAIQMLHKETYPELADLAGEDEPPQEVIELFKETPYPGVLRWLEVRDQYHYEIRSTEYADADTPFLSGMACISDKDLEKECHTRDEGALIIKNDLVMVQEYINGNLYLMTVELDDTTEYVSGIYAVVGAGAVGKIHRISATHPPDEKQLDDYLLDFAATEEDEELIRQTKWK